ncbi:MAG TPA: M17 family peptidase N-terminal domain-containing protein, partial [Actinomycetota bacterium]|nr:M17 family peptidase N-terminal domain-containing protein [Actinomycetota bacterium]
MTRFRTSTDSARDIAADVLIVPAFSDGDLGPGLKEVGLDEAYRAARLTGKKGENLLVTRREGDRFQAANVLIVGVGPKDDLDLTAMRRRLGRAAASTRRFPTVATTFARAFG